MLVFRWTADRVVPMQSSAQRRFPCPVLPYLYLSAVATRTTWFSAGLPGPVNLLCTTNHLKEFARSSRHEGARSPFLATGFDEQAATQLVRPRGCPEADYVDFPSMANRTTCLWPDCRKLLLTTDIGSMLDSGIPAVVDNHATGLALQSPQRCHPAASGRRKLNSRNVISHNGIHCHTYDQPRTRASRERALKWTKGR
jgi:hypothetical protein